MTLRLVGWPEIRAAIAELSEMAEAATTWGHRGCGHHGGVLVRLASQQLYRGTGVCRPAGRPGLLVMRSLRLSAKVSTVVGQR